MRTHTSTNEGTIKYPESIGFAFNPSPIIITGSAGRRITVSVSDGTNTYNEEREVFGGGCCFDLSPFARALFDIQGKNEPQYDEETDTGHTLSVEVTVGTVIQGGSGDPSFEFTMLFIYGMLRHGEEFNPIRHRTWFKNYPFTVGAFMQEDDGIMYTIDGNAQAIVVAPSTGIVEIPIGEFGVTESFTMFDTIGEISATTFDDVFDITFSSVDGDDITERIFVNVSEEECPRAVYLRWLDNQGFYCYWLFSWLGDNYASTVDESSTRNDMGAYDDVSGFQGWYGQRESKSETLTKTIGASMVDADTFAFLKTLLTSPRVDRYLGEFDGEYKWEAVRIVAQSTAWARHLDYQDFQCQVIMPKYNYQGV